jgi:glycerophosphoryl diester phosphodiesterase
MSTDFDIQGHRGALAHKPENTLPSFEVAIDVGATSVETDLHLTRDGVPVLLHDPRISAAACRVEDNAIPLSQAPFVSSLTLAQLRCCRADRNRDTHRFPNQDASVTPLAQWYAEQQRIDPFTPPTLADLFAFTAVYAGPAGASAGKTDEQRARAARFRFDLELKRVPYHPLLINDGYTGERPGLFEEKIVEAVRAARVVSRTTVRSFDHRCVRFLRQLEPGLTGAVLTAIVAPVSPGELARATDASIYCPNYEFLDAQQVQSAHAAGVRVLPWTVNDPDDWERLLSWQVDGITTDYPDRLGTWLRGRNVSV